jgi:hypothetical protein
MGNYCSGRRYVFDARLTVEECCALDVVFVMRECATGPGAIHSGTLHWSSSRTGTVTNRVGYVIDMNNAHVRLHYTFRSEERSQRIELVSTVPNYGGLRWWFLCPAWVQGRACLRRVRKLYLVPGAGMFACRCCCRLSYTSQREDGANRALAKAQAIRRRLGGSGSMSELFPGRPKGMWRRTYARLRATSQGLWRGSLLMALGRHSPDDE